MTLICTFLREVWGECGEAGKGKVTYRRYAPVSNLIRLSVRYDSILCILRISLALNPVCVPSIVIKVLFCALNPFTPTRRYTIVYKNLKLVYLAPRNC